MLMTKKFSIRTSSDVVLSEIKRMLVGVYGHDHNETKNDGSVIFYPSNHLLKDESKNLSIIVFKNKIIVRFEPCDSVWFEPPYSLMFPKICSIIDQIEEHYK